MTISHNSHAKQVHNGKQDNNDPLTFREREGGGRDTPPVHHLLSATLVFVLLLFLLPFLLLFNF
jgi:hypothetical protein